MIIGQIIDTLIRIKDNNRSNWNSDEIEALNEGCNVLSHNFNNMSDSYDLRHEDNAVEFSVKVIDGDVFVRKHKEDKYRFVRQLCFDNDSIGFAVSAALNDDYDDSEYNYDEEW